MSTSNGTRSGMLLSLVLAFAACSGSGAPETTAATVAAPAPVKVDPSRKDLVFRYLDPATGEVATAASVDAIPAPARREVVIYDPQASVPAGWDLVADLSAAAPVATPREHFAFATRAATTASTEKPPELARAADQAAGRDAAHEVFMFSTEGCGYCARARKFFDAHRIPYTELDLETDPKAAAKLSSLGQRAGLTERDLQGVPIFFIDGKPLLGWDQRRLESLLGVSG